MAGDHRFTVFQARMTWVTSSIASATGDATFAGHARHGLAMLERMVHQPTGAFRWEIDGARRPCGRFPKGLHAYAQAFAIFGLVPAARALGSEDALAAAQRVFAYLEARHHDRRHGGYFELTGLSGRRLFRSRSLRRHIAGGYKTMESHLHLLEAFIPLYRLWPDPILRLRIEELVELITTRWWHPPGRVHGVAGLDSEPIEGRASYGHDLEVAHLLLAAAAALGCPADPRLLARATALLDTALAESWDPEGGFFDSAPQYHALAEPAKIWWVQAEGLACLAALYGATSEPRYLERLQRHWDWIRTRQIDQQYGGWLETVAGDGRILGEDVKGKSWKEVYHEVRASILVAEGLGSTPAAMLTRVGGADGSRFNAGERG